MSQDAFHASDAWVVRGLFYGIGINHDGSGDAHVNRKPRQSKRLEEVSGRNKSMMYVVKSGKWSNQNLTYGKDA